MFAMILEVAMKLSMPLLHLKGRGSYYNTHTKKNSVLVSWIEKEVLHIHGVYWTYNQKDERDHLLL